MNKLLGSSPITTVLGYLMAAIAAAMPFVNPEYQKIGTIALAVLGALYARASKDSNGITAKESKIVAKVATGGQIPPDEKADQSIL